MQRIKLHYFLTLYTKIIARWIRYLNVKSEAIKLLEEHKHSRLFDISLNDEDFFFFPLSASSGKRNKSKNGTTSTEKLLQSKLQQSKKAPC